jgi:hypothetical protein
MAIPEGDGGNRSVLLNGVQALMGIWNTLLAMSGGGTMTVGVSTVAGLPAVASVPQGTRRFVTDANATTFASVVAGGGTNGVPVYNDATNWRIG